MIVSYFPDPQVTSQLAQMLYYKFRILEYIN